MKVLLLDNYDSFTYNLAQLLTESALCEFDVRLNDQITLDEVALYDKILISPGPGLPHEAGIICDVVREYASSKPILGICLGHQAIAEVFGAKLFQMPKAQHGQTIEVNVIDNSDSLFEGLPNTFTATLYHSWSVDPSSIPKELIVTAISDRDYVQAISHTSYPVKGLQFHPESIATQYGVEIIKNWLRTNYG